MLLGTTALRSEDGPIYLLKNILLLYDVKWGENQLTKTEYELIFKLNTHTEHLEKYLPKCKQSLAQSGGKFGYFSFCLFF